MAFLGSENQPGVPLHELVRALPISQQYRLEGIAQKALQGAGVDGAEPPYVRALGSSVLDGLPGVVAGREALYAAFEDMPRTNEIDALAAAEAQGASSLMLAAALTEAQTKV